MPRTSSELIAAAVKDFKKARPINPRIKQSVIAKRWKVLGQTLSRALKADQMSGSKTSKKFKLSSKQEFFLNTKLIDQFKETGNLKSFKL